MINPGQVSDSIIAKYQIIKKEGAGDAQNKERQRWLQLSKQMADLTFDSVESYLILTHQLKVSDAFITLYKNKGMKETNAGVVTCQDHTYDVIFIKQMLFIENLNIKFLGKTQVNLSCPGKEMLNQNNHCR